jgi:transposase
MRKLTISENEEKRIAIQQEILRSEDSKYNHRLHAVLMVASGHSCHEVAKMFKHSPRYVEDWVKRFNEKGFAGLQKAVRTGRPSQITDKIRSKLGKDLRKAPTDFGYTNNLWDGKMLAHHLKVRYGIEIGIRQCQRLFREFGFRNS